MSFKGRSFFPQPRQNVNSKTFNADEIFEAAQYIGIGPVIEPQFLWIAEEMLSAPLPDGFSEHIDDEGNVYFYSIRTGKNMWYV